MRGLRSYLSRSRVRSRRLENELRRHPAVLIYLLCKFEESQGFCQKISFRRLGFTLRCTERNTETFSQQTSLLTSKSDVLQG